MSEQSSNPVAYHQKKIVASLKSVYRKADVAFKKEIQGDFFYKGSEANPIEALRQLGEDAIDMHQVLFAQCAVETTMARVVDCSNALEQFLICSKLINKDGQYKFSSDLDRFNALLNQSYKDGALNVVENSTVNIQQAMREFLNERLKQLAGDTSAQATKAKISFTERLAALMVGQKPGKIKEGRIALRKELIAKNSSKDTVNALKDTAKKNELTSLLDELDKAIVVAGNTMEKTFEAQEKHFLSFDEDRDIWEMLKDEKNNNGSQLDRDDAIQNHTLESQQDSFHAILDQLSAQRHNALNSLCTQNLVQLKPKPVHWVWRVIGLLSAPVMLPLLTLMGAIKAITSLSVGEFLRLPRDFLHAAGLRHSAIERLASLQDALTTDNDDKLEDRIDFNDSAWNDLLKHHHVELLSDLQTNASTLAQGTATLKTQDGGAPEEALKNARRYSDAMDRVIKAFKRHCGVAPDYVGARKTTRLFMNRLQSEGSTKINYDFLPSDEASKVLASTSASHRGRGYSAVNGSIVLQGAVTADLLQKRTKVNGVSAPGVADDKCKRSQINVGLDMIASLKPEVNAGINSAEERERLADLYKKNIASTGISYKQRLIMTLAKAGALLYAVGCALQIAGGLMFIFAFPGAPVVALAFGLLFTFTYNWWLTKFALPQIMMGMLKGKKGLLHDMEHTSVLWWPALILKKILTTPLQVARVLLGVALMPLIWMIAQPLNGISYRSSFPGQGSRLYQWIMADVFGVLVVKTADTKFWKSQLQSEIRTDALLWVMFGLCALGTVLMATGTGPMVVGMLIVVAGLGTMVYKMTGGLTQFVNDQNQKKVLSKPRQFGLALLVSLVFLMGLANGALVVPGIGIFKEVLGYVGLSAYAMVVAIPVIFGTIVAMTALMLVSFADFLKKQNIMQGLKVFFVDRLWHGKVPTKSGKAPSEDQNAQAVSASNPESKGRFAWLQNLVSTKRAMHKFVRLTSFTAVVAAGMWGVASVCLTMAESIVVLSPIFSGGQWPIFIALFVSMMGLFGEVLKVLWTELANVARDPVQAMKDFKSALSNAIEWTYSIPRIGKADSKSGKFRFWYESSSVWVKTLKIAFFLPCFIVRKAVENLLVTAFQLFVIVPFLLVDSFVKAFPSVFTLLMRSGSLAFKVPGVGDDSEVDLAEANKRFMGFVRARATLRNFYTQFTRLGNATGNGLLVDASVEHAFHAPVVTIVSVAAAFMNSFAALFVTMRNKKVEKAIDEAVDNCMTVGSDSSEINAKLGHSINQNADVNSGDEEEDDEDEAHLSQNQVERLPVHEQIAKDLNLELSHKRAIFESLVVEKWDTVSENKVSSDDNDSNNDYDSNGMLSPTQNDSLNQNPLAELTPKHVFPLESDKNVVSQLLTQSFFQSKLSPESKALNKTLLIDQFGYSENNADHWVEQCQKIA